MILKGPVTPEVGDAIVKIRPRVSGPPAIVLAVALTVKVAEPGEATVPEIRPEMLRVRLRGRLPATGTIA